MEKTVCQRVREDQRGEVRGVHPDTEQVEIAETALFATISTLDEHLYLNDPYRPESGLFDPFSSVFDLNANPRRNLRRNFPPTRFGFFENVPSNDNSEPGAFPAYNILLIHRDLRAFSAVTA